MKKTFLLTFLLCLSSFMHGQTPPGRYFENINGTVWHSQGFIDTESFAANEPFYLNLLNAHVESLTSNSTILIFGETLTILHYHSDSKIREIVLECRYENNEKLRTFSFFIDDKKIIYSSVSISTGIMVSFFEPRK